MTKKIIYLRKGLNVEHKNICGEVLKKLSGPPEGGPLFEIHLNIVTAFLENCFFFN